MVWFYIEVVVVSSAYSSCYVVVEIIGIDILVVDASIS